MRILNFLKKFNWSLILPAFLLTFLGLLSIYSISLERGDFFNFKKQLIFFILSVSLLVVLNFLDFRFLKKNSYFVLILYFVSLLSLFGLIFLGTEIRGVKGWYKIGPFSFDPVPFSAIFLIILLSKYFATRHVETKRFRPIFFSFFYLLFPLILVLAQPDLGSSLVLIFVWLGIVIFSGIELRHFLILCLVFLLLVVFGWQFWLKDYQKERIMSFLNPEVDPRGISWNINQSKIAIGSGGLFGKGIGKGSQSQYGFLPEPQTDFIFPSIAEETGFFGVLVLMLSLGFLFWKIMKIALFSEYNFNRLFASGFGFLLLSQSFINIGMCLGLFPIIGIPLPFVSYGGSQLLAFYLGLGILVSLAKPEN